MAKELFVSKSNDLPDGERKIVPNGNYEIGVYRVNGDLFAYQNVCPHQGGPACEGLLMAKVEEVIAEDKTYQGMTFNHDEMHIVCPWHGWEYDVTNGQHQSIPAVCVPTFETRIAADDVEVRFP